MCVEMSSFPRLLLIGQGAECLMIDRSLQQKPVIGHFENDLLYAIMDDFMFISKLVLKCT